MKKFISYIFIISIIFSGFVVSPKTVFAQEGTCSNIPGTNTTMRTTKDNCDNLGRQPNGTIVTTWTALPNTGGSGTSSTTSSTTTSSGDACELFSLSTWGYCMVGWINLLVYQVVFKIGAIVLWLAGTILNFVLTETIVNMKENLTDFTGINIAWKVIRDLMNIVFIFMLVWEGIRMIIGSGSVQKVGRFIGMIVLASLLINFSLFFTKVLIDASNIVTIGFYNSIIDSAENTTAPGIVPNADYISGISVPFMKALGLSEIFSVSGFSQLKSQVNGDEGTMLIFLLFGTMLFIVVAFVFFAVSIMFAIRYVTLLVLLMLSPIAYMGMAIPGMSKYSGDWWKSLNGQLLFPPIFMIMTWVTLTLITSDGFIKNDASWSGVMSGDTSTIGLLFNFIIIIGLVIFSLVTARNAAKQGSSMISDATKSATAFAGGAVMSSTAKLGRQTVGRAGAALAENDWMKQQAATGNIAMRNLAKFGMTRGEKLGNATFDARNASGVSALLKTTGTDMGKGADAKKVGFVKDREAAAKAEADFAKKLKPSEDAQAKLAAEREAKMKEDEAYKASEAKANEIKANEEAYKAGQDKIKELEKQRIALEKEKAEAKLVETQKEIQGRIDLINSSIKTEQDSLKPLTEAEKKAKEEHQKLEEAIKAKAKDIFRERVEAYAGRIQDESMATQWSKRLGGALLGAGAVGPFSAGGVAMGLGGVVGGQASGGLGIRTENDRKIIANKVRGVLNEKSDKEKAQELLAKAERERLAKVKKGEADAEEGDNEIIGSENKDDKPKEPEKTAPESE